MQNLKKKLFAMNNSSDHNQQPCHKKEKKKEKRTKPKMSQGLQSSWKSKKQTKTTQNVRLFRSNYEHQNFLSTPFLFSKEKVPITNTHFILTIPFLRKKPEKAAALKLIIFKLKRTHHVKT